MLLARLAGGFQAPLVKAAGLFQAFTRNMAYGVKALIDQRIEAGEAAPRRPRPAAEAPPPRPKRRRARSGRRREAETAGSRDADRGETPDGGRREPATEDLENEEKTRNGNHEHRQSCSTSSRT